MNILFLTIANMEEVGQRGLYNDLVRVLGKKKINIYVVAPRQRREKLPTEYVKEGNIGILKVKTGNISRTSSNIEKGLSTILIEYQYRKAIRKYLNGIKFHMVIYTTPPITFARIIKYLKRKHGCRTYLILRDIFPQNAVDIDKIKKGSLLWRYFRRKEIEFYQASDMIGCMSQANVEYLLRENTFLKPEKVEIFPNSILPLPANGAGEKDEDILRKYQVPKASVLFLYGGNLGIPQGIPFIEEVAKSFIHVTNGYLLIIGSGTEFERLKNYIQDNQLCNVGIYTLLPKEEYDKLVASADVGLIFLDHRFTIPNFPSRLTAYMENSLPVIAATDKNTDIGAVISDARCGYWCESDDIVAFISFANLLAKDKDLRMRMGSNARRYLEENYDINKTIHILLKHSRSKRRALGIYTKEKPFLSICITSYKRINELVRCLNSIDTKYIDFIEIIVSEDHSPLCEEIRHEVERFSEHSAYKVIFHTNEMNLGYDRNLAKLITLSHGEYVLFISDDDCFCDHALDKVIERLLFAKGIGVAFTPYLNAQKDTIRRQYRNSKRIEKGSDNACRYLYDSILFSGLIFKRCLITAYSAEQFINLNYFQVYLFLSVLLQYDGLYINSVLIKCIGDGENAYGLSKSSGFNEKLANRKTVLSNLEFHKGLIKAIHIVDWENNTSILQYFEREYSIRSCVGLSLARREGKKHFTEYWENLSALDIHLTWHVYLYYFFIKCFGYQVPHLVIHIFRKLLFFIRK